MPRKFPPSPATQNPPHSDAEGAHSAAGSYQPQTPVMGRPTLYKPEYAAQAAKLSELGATDDQMADFFEVDVRTIHRWKHDHEDFCHSLRTGKEIADERVERSLYQRAVGFEQDSVKIFMPAGAEEPVYAPFREKLPPDVTAAIFWLKNRRRDLWRDKQEIEHSGNVGIGDRLARAKERQGQK